MVLKASALEAAGREAVLIASTYSLQLQWPRRFARFAAPLHLARRLPAPKDKYKAQLTSGLGSMGIACGCTCHSSSTAEAAGFNAGFEAGFEVIFGDGSSRRASSTQTSTPLARCASPFSTTMKAGGPLSRCETLSKRLKTCVQKPPPKPAAEACSRMMRGTPRG